jgi:hypothetical protein
MKTNENGRETTSLISVTFFLPKTGVGTGKAVAKTVAKYMGIRKQTNTNEYSTKTDGSWTAVRCTQHIGALQQSASPGQQFHAYTAVAGQQ